jgi:hypothetical protein
LCACCFSWQRKSRASRKHDTDAKRKKGGARLILNKTEAIPSGPNTRTCLLESVLALVPTETKELVRTDLLTAMPAEGDTSVSDLTNALATHGLSLFPVSGEYIKKGGAPYHLLQEHQCKLVINLRLTDLDGVSMSHFVAWDGDCIHDRPYTSKVNNTYDRTNPEKSKLWRSASCSRRPSSSRGKSPPCTAFASSHTPHPPTPLHLPLHLPPLT